MVRRVVYSRFSSFPTTWAVAYKSLSRSEEEELSISLVSLTCGEKERERKRRRRRTLVYARKRPMCALCGRVLRGRDETYVDAYIRSEHQRIFYDPGTPEIKTARRLKNRSASVDRKDDAVLSRERCRFFYIHGAPTPARSSHRCLNSKRNIRQC